MIYVHVPFCRSFCTYCDFYSEIAHGTEKAEESFAAYTSCLCREMEARSGEIARTAAVDTLYIGGGTPSVLPLSCLGTIVCGLRSVTGNSSWQEFTIEVNPDDVTEEYASALKSLGVNRVSMGVQSLDDRMLKWMNRRHDADGARRAFRILRAAGVRNVSVDVIFGMSHLSASVLDATLEELVSWRPEHISAYQLSIEDGSALAGMVRCGKYVEADDDVCRSQYELICSILSAAGYEHYEISNWALPGHRAAHNSAYWTRAPYVGLGPGAHSLSIYKDEAGAGIQKRSWNSESMSGWTSSCEILTPEEILEEEIMLGLRTLAGYNGRRLTESEWFISDTIITDTFSEF